MVLRFCAFQMLAFGRWIELLQRTGKCFRERLKAAHNFPLAYFALRHATVEYVCRKLLRAFQALCSEFKLPSKAWRSVMPLIQSSLKNPPIARLQLADSETWKHLSFDIINKFSTIYAANDYETWERGGGNNIGN